MDKSACKRSDIARIAALLVATACFIVWLASASSAPSRPIFIAVAVVGSTVLLGLFVVCFAKPDLLRCMPGTARRSSQNVRQRGLENASSMTPLSEERIDELLADHRRSFKHMKANLRHQARAANTPPKTNFNLGASIGQEPRRVGTSVRAERSLFDEHRPLHAGVRCETSHLSDGESSD